MDNIFRVVCLLIAILSFFLACHWLSVHRVAMGLLGGSATLGFIATANLIDPTRPMNLKQFILRRERFQITPIGQALHFLSIALLISAILAGWFEL